MGYFAEMWEERIEKLIDTRNITDEQSLKNALARLPTNGGRDSHRVRNLVKNSSLIWEESSVQNIATSNITQEVRSARTIEEIDSIDTSELDYDFAEKIEMEKARRERTIISRIQPAEKRANLRKEEFLGSEENIKEMVELRGYRKLSSVQKFYSLSEEETERVGEITGLGW